MLKVREGERGEKGRRGIREERITGAITLRFKPETTMEMQMAESS